MHPGFADRRAKSSWVFFSHFSFTSESFIFSSAKLPLAKLIYKKPRAYTSFFSWLLFLRKVLDYKNFTPPFIERWKHEIVLRHQHNLHPDKDFVFSSL